MLQDKIKQFTEDIKGFTPTSAVDVENFRLKCLVAKGIVKGLFEEFKTVSVEEKRTLGKALNEFKHIAEKTSRDAQSQLAHAEKNLQLEEGGLTLPAEGFQLGSRH